MRFCVCEFPSQVKFVTLPLGSVFDTRRSGTFTRPDLGNGGVFMADVVIQMVTGGAHQLDSVVTHLGNQFHRSARDGMTREVEMVDAATAIPEAPLPLHCAYMLFAEFLHPLCPHSLVDACSCDRYRHEEEVGFRCIACHE